MLRSPVLSPHRFLALFSLLAVLAMMPVVTARAEAPPDSTVVLVRYFHGTVRCQTCLRIESFTDQIMRSRFKGALKSGRIVWSAIDYDKENDTASIHRYALDAPGLILSRMVNGRETEWTKLEKIWDLADDYGKFQAYVVANVREMTNK
jgi:hypothetical protein